MRSEFLKSVQPKKKFFWLSNEPDLSTVKEMFIHLLLSKLVVTGSTSRQQSFNSSKADLSLLNIR